MTERFFRPVKKAIKTARWGLAGLALLGCAEKVQQDVSPTPITPTATHTPFRSMPEFSPTPESARPSQTQVISPTRTAEVRPPLVPQTATPPVSGGTLENRALGLDGINDGIEYLNSGHILLTGPFRIDAKIKLDKRPDIFGDTIVSKGNDFAFFARSISANCYGNVGALFEGRDFCTQVKLGEAAWHEVSVRYDGRKVTFVIDGETFEGGTLLGPLAISSQNITVGYRGGLFNLRQPLGGAIDDLRIYEGDPPVLKLSSDYNDSFGTTPPLEIRFRDDPRLVSIR
jgi:hypothetical protein